MLRVFFLLFFFFSETWRPFFATLLDFLKPRVFRFSSFSTWAERWQTRLFFLKEAYDSAGNTRFQKRVASRKPATVRAGSVRNVSKYGSSPLTAVRMEAGDVEWLVRGRSAEAPQGPSGARLHGACRPGVRVLQRSWHSPAPFPARAPQIRFSSTFLLLHEAFTF